MNRSLRIRMRKRTQAELLIDLLVLLPFLFPTMIQLLHFPWSIRYLCDVAWVFLLLLLILQRKTPTGGGRSLLRVTIGYFFITLLAIIPQLQSPFYYLWGLRNNLRFYILFLGCVYFLKQEDIEGWLRKFDILFWINAGVCLLQYALLGKRQDYLGGIFGVERGCNSYMNIFFVIVSAKSFLFYLSKRETLVQCAPKCGTAMVIAAWAELKFFYVELVVIIVVATLIADFTWRKVWILAGGFAGIVITANLLVELFPEFASFLSLKAIIATATNPAGYTGKGDLNRLTAVSTISQRFLVTPLSRIFGMGLGNCDYATADLLTTPFYHKYGWLNYAYLSIAFVFLETGYVGLLFFFGFFGITAIAGWKQSKAGGQQRLYCQISLVLAICAGMIGIYNSSLRSESGYMLYFVLSFPYVVERDRRKEGLV